MANYHNKPVEDIASEFGTDANRGLRQDEIQSRIGKYGKNTLVQKKQRSFISMFVAQFKSFLIILLIIAAVISGVMGVKTGEGLLDTYIIAGILLLNAFIGAYQEFKAQKSLESWSGTENQWWSMWKMLSRAIWWSWKSETSSLRTSGSPNHTT